MFYSRVINVIGFVKCLSSSLTVVGFKCYLG